MASIGGLSTSTSSSISSLRGYGGLASGLDRDELIEGMTSGTQTKITKQEQAKTKLEWQQQAYRDISEKMISFANKYTATMSSGTNLFSDAFWGAASTTALGTNSKFIGVSGSSKSAAANISILGVKQLANNAKIISSAAVSDRTLTTGTFKTHDADVSLLAGKNIEIMVGEKSYTVSLPYGNGDQYDTIAQVTQAVNDAMAKIDVSYTDSTRKNKLSDIVSFGYDADAKKFTFQGSDKNGNDVLLKGGTALSALGFNAGEDGININSKVSSDKEIVVEGNRNDLLTSQSFAERMGGKSLTFNYNGTSRTIELPTIGQIQYTYDNSKVTGGNIVDKFGNVLDKDGYAFDKDGNRVILNENGEVLDKNGKVVKGGSDNLVKFGSVSGDKILDKDGNVVEKDGAALTVETRTTQLEYVKEALQQSLDAAFGKNRVTADVEEDTTTGEARLTFRTTTPDGQGDASSTISITDGSAALMASRGGMGIISGENNRLNLNTAIKNSGLSSAAGMGNEDTFDLEINGKKFTFTANDSISAIMNKINNGDAGVTISYMSMADKFAVEATENGAAGELKITGTGADLLFGGWIDTNPASDATEEYKAKLAEGNSIDLTKGQDAVVAVKYAGSNEVINLTRGSNSFDIDGLNVTVKGTFGEFDKTTGELINVKPEDAVTFETNVSSDKMVSAISDLVKEYNEILELVNTQLSTRPDSDYFPLTDDQKKEMSESEIKLWEEKAKAGILFGSSELRSLSDDLRWAILPKDQQAMEAMGISVSSSWQDNGKLSFDETKFRAALEQDPDAVKAAFTASDGIASNLKNTMNKYVNTLGATKGILIEKAGSTHAPTSVLNNSLKSEIDDVDKILENLKARLKSEQDRYISQFTQLETLISQMNSQSSYLSGLGF